MEEGLGTKGTEVFVGGLSRTISEDKIREVFSSCGEILEIRLIKDLQGNLKGFCFVRFATKEAAGRAIREKTGITLDGRKIGVLPSTQQDTLYFGSLNKAWGAEEFEQIVRQVFSDVVAVDLIMLKDVQPGQKQRNRGFGFVKFSSHAAASRAQRVSSQPDFRLGNLHPAVKWAEEEPETDPKELAEIKIAFVRNLPADADENFLLQLFEPFGKIEKTLVSKKGSFPVGFVHFARRLDLDRSIKELNEKTVRGPNSSLHKLQVEVARPMDKSKKRGRDNSESNPAVQGQSKTLREEPNAILTNNHGSHVQRQEIASTDPYEDAVISLPLAVKERLLRILRLGIATRFDLDVKSLRSLNELPESSAITVLDQFMLSGATCINKGAYLDGLISKYLVDKVGQRQSLASLTRAVDTAARDSELFSFSPQLSPPTVGSLAPRALPTMARSDIYALHNTLPLSDYPLSSRTLIGRAEERRPDFLLSNGALSGPPWTLVGRAEGRSSDFHISNHPLLGPPHQSMQHLQRGSDFQISNEALSQHHQIMQLQRTGRLEDEDSDYRLLSTERISGSHQNMQLQTTGRIEDKISDYHRISNQNVSGPHQSMQLPGVARLEDKISDYHLLSNQSLSRHQRMQLPAELEERTRSPLEALAGSSIGHGRVGLLMEEHRFSPAEAAHNSNTSTSYARHGMSSVSDVATVDNQQAARPQVRFDPFTGEQYKFDPFTGEPIRQ